MFVMEHGYVRIITTSVNIMIMIEKSSNNMQTKL